LPWAYTTPTSTCAYTGAVDRTGIRELYAHLDFAWRQIVPAVEEAGEAAFSRPVPGSGWPAPRNCLADIVFGYDRWLAIMTARPSSGVAEGIRTLAGADAARAAVRGQIDALLDSMNDDALQQAREFDIDGVRMPYSYAELLTHLALHERGHHGDITTLLYQLGLNPDRQLDYRFHLGRAPRG